MTSLLGLALPLALMGCANPDSAKGGPGDDSGPSGQETGGADDSADSAETADEPLFQLSGTPTNLLVISVDTLRRDAMGAYTGDGDTPTLDGLAAEGVLLTHHRTCSSWTYPGIICAMTGKTSEALGFAATVPDRTEDVVLVPTGTQTQASVLQALGYQTLLVSSNGYLAAGTGMIQGFTDAWLGNGFPAAAITTEALDLVDSDLDLGQPWMLHVHYIDPHSPYDPPDEYLTGIEDLPEISYDLSTEEGTNEATNAYDSLDAETQAAVLAHMQLRYAGEVRYVDDQIAALMSALDERGALDDTLVLFWADHGEQLFEHGGRGHATSLFGEETDGAAFFWARGMTPGTWDGLTTSQDLAPTALSLMGVVPPEPMDGVVVGTRPEDTPIFAILTHNGRPPVQTVAVGDEKLVYTWSGKKAFFRRDSDPGEQDDVYAAADPDVIALWDLLSPEVAALEPLIGDWTPESPGP